MAMVARRNKRRIYGAGMVDRQQVDRSYWEGVDQQRQEKCAKGRKVKKRSKNASTGIQGEVMCAQAIFLKCDDKSPHNPPTPNSIHIVLLQLH